MPWLSKKKFQHNLYFSPITSQVLLCDDDDFHSGDCWFVCGSYKKHHVSSSVIMLLWILLSLSAVSLRSSEILIHVSFYLGVSIRGAERWQTLHTFNTSWRILWQLQAEIPTSDAVCPQIFFCHFSWSLSHAEHLLHLLTLMGDHCADHCQHSCVHHGSVYAWHTPEIFPLLCHPPYACCNMINVAASDLFIYCSGADIFNYSVTTCTLKEQTTAVMPFDVLKWRNYLCDVMRDTNLWDRPFPHASIPVNYTSEFWEFLKLLYILASYR